jgi:hypothetical protein
LYFLVKLGSYVLLKLSVPSQPGVMEGPSSFSLLGKPVDRGVYIEKAFKASVIGSVRLWKMMKENISLLIIWQYEVHLIF